MMWASRNVPHVLGPYRDPPFAAGAERSVRQRSRIPTLGPNSATRQNTQG